MRELFCANAAYWIDEFHLDGLRLDATQEMFDQSPEHILAQLTRRVREARRQRPRGRGRVTCLVAIRVGVRAPAPSRAGRHRLDLRKFYSFAAAWFSLTTDHLLYQVLVKAAKVS